MKLTRARKRALLEIARGSCGGSWCGARRRTLGNLRAAGWVACSDATGRLVLTPEVPPALWAWPPPEGERKVLAWSPIADGGWEEVHYHDFKGWKTPGQFGPGWYWSGDSDHPVDEFNPATEWRFLPEPGGAR